MASFLLLAASAVPAFCAHTSVVEGNPASAVKVLVYEDLQSPECAAFRSLLDQKFLPRYGSRVAFVHRDFPLARHDWARWAAIAARWVSEQDPDTGVVLRRELLAEQNALTAQNLKPWLAEFAVRNKLDPKAMLDALNDPRLTALVDQDLQSGTARGVTLAPTAFVGGQIFTRTIVYEDLARALDEALK